MFRIFSPLNILILVVVAGVAYLGYDHFSGPGENVEVQPESESRERGEESKSPSPGSDKRTSGSEQEHTTPTPGVVQEQKETLDATGGQRGAVIDMSKERTYESRTYNYRITFPKEWPLVVRNKKEIIFGYIEPREGLGSLEVKTGEDLESELQEEVRQARSGSELEVRELNFSVDRVPATKYILTDPSGDKDFYILVENSGLDHIIKYSNESPSFVGRSEQVVESFEFIK